MAARDWRPCSCDVQKHPRLAEIESALWRGWDVAKVSRHFAIHHHTIRAHWEKHMPGKRAVFVEIGPAVSLVPEAPPSPEEEEASLDALSALAASAEPPPPPVKRPRGRPKGSKNGSGRKVITFRRRARRVQAMADANLPKPIVDESSKVEQAAGEAADSPDGAELDPEFSPEAMQEPASPADGPGVHSRNLAARCRAAGKTWQTQVDFLCHLLDSGKFYFGHTLDWAKLIWGVNQAQIKARFESAVKRCSGYRQSVIANTIATISALENQEREAMAAWNRSKRLNAPNPRFLQLAIQARSKIAYAAGVGHQTLKLDTNIWVRPEFVQAVDQLTEVALNTLAPAQDEQFKELVARVEERLGKGADPGVVAAVLETAADIMSDRLQLLAKQHGEDSGPPEGEVDLPGPEEGLNGTA